MTSNRAPALGVITDRDWLAAVYEQHAAGLRQYLRARVGAHGDDVLSEVFLAAWSSRDQFDPQRGCAVGWLYGIASNLLRRHHRSESAQLRAVARIEPGASAFPDLAHEQAEAAEQVRRLVPDLLALDPADRDIVLLVAWGGLTPSEVAVALDLPAGTVRSRLSRVRARLRRVHAEEPSNPETRRP